MTVAFVLAGGGSLAATQVGMLRALVRSGVRPDIVVGTSAGAINAFCFAQHPTERGLDRLQHLWCGVRRRDVFPVNAWHIVAGLMGRRDGVVSPRRLRAFLGRHVGSGLLQDTTVPVHIVTTDLAEGQPVVLSAGSALEALVASAAMPGVFPPVVVGHRTLVDGGVTSDIPLLEAEELGATETYVLPTVGPSLPWQLPHGAVPVLLQAVSHLFGRAAATDLAQARGTVHVLPAPADGAANPFDFASTTHLIDASYQAAMAALAGTTAAQPV